MKKIVLLFALLSIVGCRKETSEEAKVPAYSIPQTQKTAKELEFERIMKARRISFEQVGDCDEDALGDTIHKRDVAYIDALSVSESGVKANFKFISNCCHYFAGDYKTNRDTLIFTYENVGDEECSCLCWHRYRLSIANPPAGVRHVKLVSK